MLQKEDSKGNLLGKLYLEMTGWLLIKIKLMQIQSQTDCVADRVKHVTSDHWPDVVRTLFYSQI